MDLELPAHYFARLMDRMEADPRPYQLRRQNCLIGQLHDDMNAGDQQERRDIRAVLPKGNQHRQKEAEGSARIGNEIQEAIK